MKEEKQIVIDKTDIAQEKHIFSKSKFKKFQGDSRRKFNKFQDFCFSLRTALSIFKQPHQVFSLLYFPLFDILPY